MTDIAFIGLGNMGAPMCANLVAAGHAVRAFDTEAAAVERAVADGARGAASLGEAVRGAEVVLTMLPAGEQVLSVLFDERDGVAAHAAPGTLLVDCSTIAVDDAREAARRAARHDLPMLDAPVSGGVAGAAAGTLTFMVGGASETLARARPLLETMGANVFHAGGAGNGQAAKLANNLLLAISMIGTCEAFDLAARLGLDAQTFFDIGSKASGQCWSMTAYCPAPGPVPNAPSNRDYVPGFAVDMMLKDVRLALEAGASRGAAPELGALAERVYRRLHEAGEGGRDFSVVLRELGDGGLLR